MPIESNGVSAMQAALRATSRVSQASNAGSLDAETSVVMQALSEQSGPLYNTLMGVFDSILLKHGAEDAHATDNNATYTEIPYYVNNDERELLTSMFKDLAPKFTQVVAVPSGLHESFSALIRHQLLRKASRAHDNIIVYGGDFVIAVRKPTKGLHYCMPTAETFTSVHYERCVDSLTIAAMNRRIDPEQRIRSALFVANHKSKFVEHADAHAAFVERFSKSYNEKHNAGGKELTFAEITAKYGSEAVVCCDASKCEVKADVMVFDHTDTDISIYQVAQTMQTHGASQAYGTFFFDANSLADPTVVSQPFGFRCRTTKEKVIITFPGKESGQMEFNLANYMSLFQETYFEYKGVCYIRELEKMSNGLWSYHMRTTVSRGGSVGHNFLLSNMVGMVAITMPRIKPGTSNPRMAENYEQKTFYCPADLWRDVYGHALMMDKLKFSEIHSFCGHRSVKTFNNYVDVIKATPPSVEDISAISTAAMCLAFVENYNADEVIRRISKQEKLDAWLRDRWGGTKAVITVAVALVWAFVGLYEINDAFWKMALIVLKEMNTDMTFMNITVKEVKPRFHFSCTLEGITLPDGTFKRRGEAMMVSTFRKSHPCGETSKKAVAILLRDAKELSVEARKALLERYAVPVEVYEKVISLWEKKGWKWKTVEPEVTLQSEPQVEEEDYKPTRLSLLMDKIEQRETFPKVDTVVKQEFVLRPADPALRVPLMHMSSSTTSVSMAEATADFTQMEALKAPSPVVSMVMDSKVFEVKKDYPSLLKEAAVVLDGTVTAMAKFQALHRGNHLKTATVVDIRPEAVRDVDMARMSMIGRYVIVYDIRVNPVARTEKHAELVRRLAAANGVKDRFNVPLGKAITLTKDFYDLFIQAPDVSNASASIRQMYNDVMPQNSITSTKWDPQLAEASDIDVALEGNKMRISLAHMADARKRKGLFESTLGVPGVPDLSPTSLKSLVAALAKRNFNVAMVSTEQDPIATCVRAICRWHAAWGHKESWGLSADFENRRIGDSLDGFTDWVNKLEPTKLKQLYGLEVSQLDLLFQNLMSNGLMVKDKVKARAEDGVNDTKHPGSQTISSHPVKVIATTSNVFGELFDRMQSLLNSKTYVASKKKKEDIDKFLRKAENLKLLAKWLEIDMAQYDKSQQRMCYLLEMAWYLHLGLCPVFLEKWIDACVRTSLTCDPIKLWLDYQRRSGNAPTTFGNTSISMLTVADSYDLHMFELIQAYFVGDDSAIQLLGFTDALKGEARMADIYNLNAMTIVTDVPQFCSGHLITRPEFCGYMPDPIKRVERLATAVTVRTHDPKTGKRIDALKEKWISFKDNMSSYQNYVALLALDFDYRKRIHDMTGRSVPSILHGLLGLAHAARDFNVYRSLFEKEAVYRMM